MTTATTMKTNNSESIFDEAKALKINIQKEKFYGLHVLLRKVARSLNSVGWDGMSYGISGVDSVGTVDKFPLINVTVPTISDPSHCVVVVGEAVVGTEVVGNTVGISVVGGFVVGAEVVGDSVKISVHC